MKPHIEKLGTIDLDLVETTPIVFRDRLYRFESIRTRYAGNERGRPYFRFVDHETGETSRPFARDYELGNIFVEDDILYVTGTEGWGGERIVLFVSSDMERWDAREALHRPGWTFYNTSLCRAEDRYVLMLELGKPREMVGKPFTARFAVSTDMQRWDLLPPECLYAKDRYTAPHCLRYHEGYFYNFYLEALPHGYEQYVVRSRDLVHWEPRNSANESAARRTSTTRT